MDEQLLAQCRWEAFRGSGPGGQKRNKTSSVVRITHIPTGLSAIASESRSQSENRKRALRRLRHRMVLELRLPVDCAAFTPPGWLTQSMDAGRLRVSSRNERYPAVAGLVLDLLAARDWSVSDAAALLGLSTGNLVRFIRQDPHLWAHVNQQRTAAGLRILVG